MTHPVLYHKSKDGSLRQWRTWADGTTVRTEYGVVGGALQTSAYTAKPTNVGRSNERDAEAQAIFEAAALHEFKLSRKYSITPEKAEEELFLPMLATDIEKIKKPTYVGHAQPKLDGVRCIASLADGAVQLMSRSGKPYSVPHIEEALLPILSSNPGLILDGELYAHGLSCQTVTSLVKRNQPETLKIGYFVYDIPAVGGRDALSSQERMQMLIDGTFIKETAGPIFTAPTHEVSTKEEVYDLQRAFIQDGYEGAMLRLPETPYEWGYRSKGLLKIKTFNDLEAEVIGAREGEGKMTGCVVWLCKTTDGKEFEASHACTMEQRATYWRERAKYIGKKLTVKHFGTTDDGVPRFPVGKVFRDAKDLG